MKKIISPLIISIIGGFIALFVHNISFNHEVDLDESTDNKLVNISFNPNTNLVSESSLDFVEAAEKTIHSVVHVKNTSISKGQSSLWNYFNDNQNNRTRVGMGSGVIISKDGYIITNTHVIENASSIEVTTNNNKTYQADLIGSDEVLILRF